MLRQVFSLPAELYRNRRLVLKLAKNDFKTKYAGSYLGIVWAFVQPIVTVLVYWFVFSVGFKAGTGDLGVPFVLYLVAGIVPWFFVAFIILLYTAYGRFPDIYYLQLVYYTFCVFALVLGLTYATCAIVVFFRDLTQIISIILQVGVWLTPIMWVAETMLVDHPMLHQILKLNPMYYVVSGYRDAFIMKNWFWEHPGWTLYFWAFTVVCFLFGSWVFNRLKGHFADVL